MSDLERLDRPLSPLPAAPHAVTPPPCSMSKPKANSDDPELVRELAALRAQLEVSRLHRHSDLIPMDSSRQNGNNVTLAECRTAAACGSWDRRRLLAEGSFGEVWQYPAQVTVYKTVRELEHDDQLEMEFLVYSDAYAFNSESHMPGVFHVPQPREYYRPASSGKPMKLLISISRPALLSDHRRRPSVRETSYPSTLWSLWSLPTFAMDIIPSIHPHIAERYKSLFWSESLRDPRLPIRLLRLYFGREDIPPVTTALQPGLKSDPPLDIPRYEKLAEEMASGGVPFPPVGEVCTGMGEVLAKLHWGAGVNARDAELVLGGGNGPHGVQCYAFDFNQCQRWLVPHALRLAAHSPSPTLNITHGFYSLNTLSEGAKRLAHIISGQELYYPRPHQTTPYTEFKQGYMTAVETLLAEYKATVSEEDKGRWEVFGREVRDASDAFFGEFDKLDGEKVARRNRQSLPKKG